MVKLERLAQYMVPPDAGGDVVDWDYWESRLGFAFPEDYKVFMSSYGGGVIDGEFAVISLLDGGSTWLEENESLATMFEPEGNPGYATSGYPAHFGVGGLVCWAVNSGSEFCYWHAVSDDPNDWPVVIFSAGHEMWMQYDGCMVDFLAALLVGEVEFPFTMDFPRTSTPDFLADRDQKILKDAGIKWWRYRTDPVGVIEQMQTAGIEPTRYFASARQHMG